MSDIIERAAGVAVDALEDHHEEVRRAVREACGFDLGPPPNRDVEVWTVARALADAGLLWPEVTNEMVEAAREPRVGDPAGMWTQPADDARCVASSPILFCSRSDGHDGPHAARGASKWVRGVWE